MSPFKNKLLLNIILIFSITALSAAYFIQFILGHKPCNLCLIERIPYISSIILISLIFILQKFERVLILLIGLLFLFGTAVSFYHVGIEQGYFNESLVCNLSSFSNNLTNEELLKQLAEKPVSCKDVTFSIFGISLATFNTIISAVISGIMLRKFLKND